MNVIKNNSKFIIISIVLLLFTLVRLNQIGIIDIYNKKNIFNINGINVMASEREFSFKEIDEMYSHSLLDYQQDIKIFEMIDSSEHNGNLIGYITFFDYKHFPGIDTKELTDTQIEYICKNSLRDGKYSTNFFSKNGLCVYERYDYDESFTGIGSGICKIMFFPKTDIISNSSIELYFLSNAGHIFVDKEIFIAVIEGVEQYYNATIIDDKNHFYDEFKSKLIAANREGSELFLKNYWGDDYIEPR